MSSTKNKTETKSKAETCWSDPAKKKLLIKIGVGVGVAAVLLVVIIAVAVVMTTRSDDTNSNPKQDQGSKSGADSTSNAPTTTTTPISTTERARLVPIGSSKFDVITPSTLGVEDELLVLDPEKNIQWIYFEKEDYAIYIIQKFNERTGTIVATTRGANDLENNYNGTILFCEESTINGTFVRSSSIQESQPSREITTQVSNRMFQVPSVILPLQTDKCSILPDRLRYKTEGKTIQDILGPVCNSLVSADMTDVPQRNNFPENDCSAPTSLESVCGCYKECLNCTLGPSRPSQLPTCHCNNYVESVLDFVSCSGTEDDGKCNNDKSDILKQVQQPACSCLFGVYSTYPCGTDPSTCQGSDCTLRWCFGGFRYPVDFSSMCPASDRFQCT